MEHIEIGRVRFGEALTVASVLKVLAVLTVITGAIAALAGAVDLGNAGASAGEVAGYTASVVGATIVSSALFAFLGYVLEILVAVFEQLWHVRYGSDDVGD